MRVVFISDTHNKHHELNLPEGDIIIHSGDFTMRGDESEADDFLAWFASLNFKHKIFIAGNHDFCFEEYPVESIREILPVGVHYLCNDWIEVEGMKIYGSPVTPIFCNLAFNVERGAKIREVWQSIPSDTDILITHGAPYGVLDQTISGVYTGCEDLLECSKAIKLRYHLFGHIHERYGAVNIGGTTFINGSVLDFNYRLTNNPVVFEIDNV